MNHGMERLAMERSTTEGPAAERVRTVLARGAGGAVEAGLLRRPVRSARVRDDGVVALVVDVGGGRVGGRVDVGGGRADVLSPGATASVEIVDTVCTGRCRGAGSRPSFAVDGRVGEAATCGDACTVARGIITLSGIVTASSPSRPRRLVAAERGSPTGHEASALRLAELRPLEVSYLASDGVHVVRAADLAAAVVDPVGVDEQAWLRRFAADPGLAARVALQVGRQIAGTDPWIVGVDRRGIDLAFRAGGVDLAFRAGGGVPREFVRVPFAQVCSSAEDVDREIAALAD